MRALHFAATIASLCLAAFSCTPGGDPPDVTDARPAASSIDVGRPAASPSGAAPATSPPPPSPIDSARVGPVDRVASWAFSRKTSADLDGDGAEESVVLTSDVTLRNDQPLWEDGHRWAVYVVSRDGIRTLLYGAFVPNGSVEVAVLEPDRGAGRRVRVAETTPQGLRVFTSEYSGAGNMRLVSSEAHEVARWLRI